MYDARRICYRDGYFWTWVTGFAQSISTIHILPARTGQRRVLLIRFRSILLTICAMALLFPFHASAQTKDKPKDAPEVKLGRDNAAENEKEVKLITDPLLVDRVNKAVVWVNRKKRWVDGLRRQANGRELGGCRVEAIGVYAFAGAAFFRVSADVDEILFFVRGRRRGRDTSDDQEKKQDR